MSRVSAEIVFGEELADTTSKPPRGRRRSSVTGFPTWVPWAFLLPGFLLFLLIVAYPMVRSFQISLYDWSVVPTKPSTFVGLDNYVRGLNDPKFWLSMENAGIYLILTVPAQIILGLFFAVLLEKKMPARTMYRVLFYLPVVTSWVVVSLVFKFLFNTQGGAINWFLMDVLDVIDQPIGWLENRWTGLLAVSILGVWKGVGWAVIIFLAALSGVSKDLQEAASLDGANAWQSFRDVSLPAIRKTLLFVSVLLVIGAFNVFISVLLMTGGGPADSTEVPLTYMYKQAFEFLDFGYGAALSFILAIFIFAMSFAQFRLFRADD
jgi:multiple sugar transport system permease protein